MQALAMSFLKMIFAFNLFSPVLVHKPLPARELRDTSENYIVIHYDSSSSSTITWKYLRKKGNAYHYLIDRKGTIIKMIDPKYRARHAGLSYYDGHFELNKYSIGICLVNNGVQPYTQQQYMSLSWLIAQLQKRYHNITTSKIIGHSDIAIPRGRKKDPGPQFNWLLFFSLIHTTYNIPSLK